MLGNRDLSRLIKSPGDQDFALVLSNVSLTNCTVKIFLSFALPIAITGYFRYYERKIASKKNFINLQKELINNFSEAIIIPKKQRKSVSMMHL